MATTKYDIGDELYAVPCYGGSVVNKIKVGGISITKDGVIYIDGTMPYEEDKTFKTQEDAIKYVRKLAIKECDAEMERLQQEIDNLKDKMRELENAKNM